MRERVRARPSSGKKAVLSSRFRNPAARTMRNALGITASRGCFNDCACCWKMYPSTAIIDFEGEPEPVDVRAARQTRGVIAKITSFIGWQAVQPPSPEVTRQERKLAPFT